jgi:hypothetical protein
MRLLIGGDSAAHLSLLLLAKAFMGLVALMNPIASHRPASIQFF